jgi:hypothetical protein
VNLVVSYSETFINLETFVAIGPKTFQDLLAELGEWLPLVGFPRQAGGTAARRPGAG